MTNRFLYWWTLADGALKKYDHAGVLLEHVTLPAGIEPASVAVSPALFP